MMKRYDCIGLMSGTSLDGLDLCSVTFEFHDDCWSFEINATETISYKKELRDKLATAENLSGFDLMLLSNEFGRFIGKSVLKFINKHNIKPLFIASHGHTIFHQPDKNITVQIGSGASIAAECGLPVISDFRSLDVALGGQGAPLVPIGDEMLFPSYDFCLNLGGFANLSTNIDGVRMAYDICPVNIVMNHFTRKVGLEFDENGAIARTGSLSIELLDRLNTLDYYARSFPKSLGKEWVVDNILPLLEQSGYSMADMLRTFVEHVAMQISNCIKGQKSILVTGGGAYNSYLLERLIYNSDSFFLIPDDNTIQYKEALVFAFLGLLRYLETPNSLKSVTGASKNSIGGSIYLG